MISASQKIKLPAMVAPGVSLVAVVPNENYDLKTTHELMVGFAATCIEDDPRERIQPMWMLVEARTVCFLVTDWTSGAEKIAMQHGVRSLIATGKCDMFSFLCDAWMAEVDSRVEPTPLRIPVRERTGRVDVIQVITCQRDGAHKGSHWVYDYGPDGERIVRGGVRRGLVHEQEDGVLSGASALGSMFQGAVR